MSETPPALPDGAVPVEAFPPPGQIAAGDLIDRCAIDLPKNDVVESIEFERFFVLDLRFQEHQRPATLMSAWLSMSDGISTDEAATLDSTASRGAPLSDRIEDWQVRAAPTPPTARFARASAGQQQQNIPNVNPMNTSDLRLAFYLPYRQEWQLRGYNRGRMVSSLTLGPQEEQTIEIFTWERMRSSLDSSTSFDTEQTNESSGTRRDTTDITNDIARQAGFELTSDAKVGFKVEVVSADISAGMSAQTAIDSAEKDARQSIVEATSRAATHVRSSRTLKVSESREYGHETRVTRKLRNHNTCHTLTTAFFEILANYSVSTQLDSAGIRLVVLLKSSELSRITGFDRRVVRSHERTLRLALLDSTLGAGLDAARYLDARDRACEILCTGCSCGPGAGGAGTQEQWVALAAALAKIGTIADELSTYGVFFPFSIPLAVAEAALGAGAGVKDIKRHMFTRALVARAPRLVSDLHGLGLATATMTPSMADSAMGVINAVATPDLVGLLVDEGVTKGEWFLIYAFLFPLNPMPDPISQGVKTATATGALVGSIPGWGVFDDGGLVGAMNDVKAKYAAWRAYLAEKLEDDEALAAMERIASEERSLRVLDAFPLRETAQAMERLEALLDHLNDERNIDHYRFAVWNERAGSSDPQLLALALAGFTEGAPVGVVGDDLAVPVRLPPGSPLADFFAASIAGLVAMAPLDVDDHLLPTSALYAEAIPGVCSGCEASAEASEQLDLARKGLDNSLLQLEIDRLKARLDGKLLDGPSSDAPIKVEVINATAGAGTVPS